jgi:flagellar hook-length control protein FliK
MLMQTNTAPSSSSAANLAALLSSPEQRNAAPQPQAGTPSFAEMLRDNSAAPAPAPAPAAANTAAKPAEGQTEAQRQESKLNARRAAGTREASPKTPHAVEDAPAPEAAPAEEAADVKAQAAEPVQDQKRATEDESDQEVEAVEAQDARQLAPAEASLLPNTLLMTQILAAAPKAAVAKDAAAGESRPEANAIKGKSSELVLPADAEGSAVIELDEAAHKAAPRNRGRDAAVAERTGQQAAADADQKQTPTKASAQEFATALQSAVSGNAAANTARGTTPAAARGDAGAQAVLAAAGAGTAANAAPSDKATSTAPSVSLAQPLYSSSFAPELAARVSLLAANGVQEAQLMLNPADMGPVNVQIVVEGQQAQVSFHAEQADTRQVLESSLPDLAAALRDAGLTLSGGGVFQQQQPQDQGQQGERRNTAGSRADMSAIEGSAPVARANVARETRGVLDLYA